MIKRFIINPAKYILNAIAISLLLLAFTISMVADGMARFADIIYREID